MDGTNNFRDSYSPALGAVISRTLGEHGALYLEPIWVNNSNLQPSEVVDDNDSVLLGLGARIRVRPTVYLTFEGVPRVAGYAPDSTQIGFGLEKRSGGHLFQLVVFQRLRHDDRTGRARCEQHGRLVPRLRHLTQVLLTARRSRPFLRLRSPPIPLHIRTSSGGEPRHLI